MAIAKPPRSSPKLLYIASFLLFIPPLSLSFTDSLESLLDSIHSFGRQSPSPTVQISAAREILSRLLPNHTSSFHFGFISEEECGGKACFLIANAQLMQSSEGAEISISGSSGVEILAGLHWYLKYWCGAHISWKKTGGVQLESVAEPGFLPLLNDSGVKVQRVVPWSYYQNVVTASYSSVWWDWNRWEQEIDWMALQGINLPLAFTGQEAIWQKVFEGYNLSRDDLNNFFGGPAFLAWARMGNLHGWGGPLQQSWMDKQLILQKKILNYIVRLGMTPVLPAFSGNVPAALRRIFPDANITQLGDWNTVDGDQRWCCTFLLDPNDNLFVEIGRSFVQQQIKEYGSITHVYNCDTFNENEPPTNDTSYIASLGAAVYKGMQAGDSEAVWLMQGWLFASDSSFWKPPQMEALLHSVPAGKMIVIDLFAEVEPIWNVSSHFYGTPYIWCMLHNFGGNHEMYGVIDIVGSGPIEARTNGNSTMVGIGMCMEGIEQNPVVYEMIAEMAYRSEVVDVEKWVKEYSLRRYGGPNDDAENAWVILARTVYNCTDGMKNHNTDIISKFPNEDATSMVLENVPGHLWYSVEVVYKALNDLLSASDFLGHLPTYRYDVVDLTRQVLAKYANQLYYEIISTYQSGTYEELRNKSNELLDLISDMESLLNSNDCFLLGNWLESAKTFGDDTNERNMYEWNARTQITMWFDNTVDKPSELHDYANKYWSGLVGDYYLPRAALYLDLLEKSLASNSTFPFEEWQKRWISLTNSWQSSTNVYPTEPTGDSIEIAIGLSQKYQKLGKTFKDRLQSSQESVISSL